MGTVKRLPQVTFTSGELDPLMVARDDSDVYSAGLARCRNFALLSQGGVTRRPGSKVHAVLPDLVKFHTFVFNISQRYLFVFSAGKLDIYHDDGSLATSLTDQRWTAAQLATLYFASSGDTTIVCHETMVTVIILRVGATTFLSNAFQFEIANPLIDPPKIFQPYFKFARPGVTIQSSATDVGPTTLTTSDLFFVDGHVGTYLRINEDGEGFKQVKITAITNEITATGSIIEVLSGTGATIDWDEQVMSEVRGYPKTALFYLSRLWFGGSRSLPVHMFASNTSAFFKFDEGIGLPAESIQVGIQADRIAEIKGLLGLGNLLIFTDQGEGSVAHSSSNPLTPGSFNFDKDTSHGSGDVPPVEFDGAALFIQRTGKVLREVLFSDSKNAYSANSVSLISAHLFNSPVALTVSVGTSDQPEQYAYIVNGDGTMIQYHAVRSEAVVGFSLWETQGLYKQVSNVGDVLFIAVSRVTATNPFSFDFSDEFGPAARTTYLEEVDVATTLDLSQSSSSLTPVTTFSGFDLLSGRTVDVVEGDIHHGLLPVSEDGEITLNNPALSITAGLDYVPTFTTLPASVSGVPGILIAEFKRMIDVTIITNETINMVVEGEELIVRQVTDDLSLSPKSLTGRRRFSLGGYSQEAQLTITQTSPLPLTVLGLQLTISVP